MSYNVILVKKIRGQLEEVARVEEITLGTDPQYEGRTVKVINPSEIAIVLNGKRYYLIDIETSAQYSFQEGDWQKGNSKKFDRMLASDMIEKIIAGTPDQHFKFTLINLLVGGLIVGIGPIIYIVSLYVNGVI